eukprot:3694551-Amphidinium_carterae.1
MSRRGPSLSPRSWARSCPQHPATKVRHLTPASCPSTSLQLLPDRGGRGTSTRATYTCPTQ